MSGTSQLKGVASMVMCGAVSVAVSGCTHTVKVEAPDKPITINLNVKIDQEVRVRLEEDIDTMIENNPDIF